MSDKHTELNKNLDKQAERQWEEELIRRIEWIEKASHEPEKTEILTKRDYIEFAIVIIICLGAVVAGAFLAV